MKNKYPILGKTRAIAYATQLKLFWMLKCKPPF